LSLDQVENKGVGAGEDEGKEEAGTVEVEVALCMSRQMMSSVRGLKDRRGGMKGEQGKGMRGKERKNAPERNFLLL
jgi:hypothetical protein